ncbi:MAG TPA: hypothetical protein VFA40_06830 [Terriglobales bacterium]|nr:hypothetical protein [Terriglobales bacterium]
MDEQELDGVVARLLQEEQYAIAEKTLRRVHAEALEANRVDPAVRALGHLTGLYTMQESLGDAEDCHAEIEKLEGTAWSLVSFSWFYLYGKQDFQEAAVKSEEAIARARQQGDTSALYAALSARGQSLIKLDRSAEVEEVLAEMLEMVSQRKKLVPGDELLLLELAKSKGIAQQYVSPDSNDRPTLLSGTGFH